MLPLSHRPISPTMIWLATMLILDGSQGAVYCMCPTSSTYQLIQTTDQEFRDATGIVYWQTEIFVQKNGKLVGRWKLNGETGKLVRVSTPVPVAADIAFFSGGLEQKAFAITTNNQLLMFSSSLADVASIPLPLGITDPLSVQAFNNDVFIIDMNGNRLIHVNAANGTILGTRSDYAIGAGDTRQSVQLTGIIPAIDGYWVAIRAHDRIAHLTPDLSMDGVLPVSTVRIRPYRIMAGIKGIEGDGSGRVAVFSSSSIDISTGTEHSPIQYLSIVPDKLKELNQILEQIPLDDLMNNPSQSVLSRPEVKAFLQQQTNGAQP